MSAANLVQAACELHALLLRRSAAGLGPLVGANGFFPNPDDPATNPQGELYDQATSMQHRTSRAILEAATEAIMAVAQLLPRHPLSPLSKVFERKFTGGADMW